MSILSTPPIGLPILLGVQQKPVLVATSASVNAGTPVTLELARRERGIFLVAFIARHAGGTATPATPTGWTSLATNTADPEYRIVYKFCDGTEAPTATSGATSATSMSAIVLAFKHNLVLVPQSGGAATGTSTAPDATSFTPTRLGMKYFTWCMWNGDAAVDSYPSKYSIGKTTIRQGTGGGQAVIGRQFDAIAEDAGPFTLTASVLWGARTISIPGPAF